MNIHEVLKLPASPLRKNTQFTSYNAFRRILDTRYQKLTSEFNTDWDLYEGHKPQLSSRQTPLQAKRRSLSGSLFSARDRLEITKCLKPSVDVVADYRTTETFIQTLNSIPIRPLTKSSRESQRLHSGSEKHKKSGQAALLTKGSQVLERHPLASQERQVESIASYRSQQISEGSLRRLARDSKQKKLVQESKKVINKQFGLNTHPALMKQVMFKLRQVHFK